MSGPIKTKSEGATFSSLAGSSSCSDFLEDETGGFNLLWAAASPCFLKIDHWPKISNAAK